MDFTVVNAATETDDDGNVTTTNITQNFTGVLDLGTFNVWNSDEHLILTQPWKFASDGTRLDWENVEEAIKWYQDSNNHITGE
tara:strand:+ start:446 stop:694 length:249 start_codon:yes stop_codon:yes gene_type:complete